MKITNIRELCYELYKLNWLNTNVSTRIQMDNLLDYYEVVENGSSESYEEYLGQNGFGYEIYVCFDEFIDFEYRDRDFIGELLADNNKLFAKYEKDLESLIANESSLVNNSPSDGGDHKGDEDNSWLEGYGPELEEAWRELDGE